MFENAERIHTALTANVEKRALIWLARRMPRAVGPDHLTILALVSQVAAGYAYAMSSRHPLGLWVVNVFLILNWFGDSLDGTLARVRNQQRPRYGFYVDHVADMLGAFALIGGLGCSRWVHWPVAVGMLICFYALSIESYLATYTLGRFHVSHGIFGPTEIRILLAAGNIAIYVNPYLRIAGRNLLLFDVGGIVAILGMVLMLALAAARHTIALYREETRG